MNRLRATARPIYLGTVVALFCIGGIGADRTYRNPVLFADYSDPDVVRVGEDFYMVSSSFQVVPGLPILHSKDLMNWTIIGHAIERLPSPRYNTPQNGGGVWAPSIRFHQGFFWIYYGDPDLGVFMTKARDPRGPWDKPVLVREARGWIDPCPLWEPDGSAFLVHAWAKSRAGFNSILTVHRLSPDGTRVLDDGVPVFDGHDEHPTIEGPKFYRRNGYYYIFAPAGGVKTGWQTVLRSRNPLGPYESRIVLEQGKTDINGPHQGAWIDTPSGESWFVHFQDRGAYGRIIHLQPMQWICRLAGHWRGSGWQWPGGTGRLLSRPEYPGQASGQETADIRRIRTEAAWSAVAMERKPVAILVVAFGPAGRSSPVPRRAGFQESLGRAKSDHAEIS